MATPNFTGWSVFQYFFYIFHICNHILCYLDHQFHFDPQINYFYFLLFSILLPNQCQSILYLQLAAEQYIYTFDLGTSYFGFSIFLFSLLILEQFEGCFNNCERIKLLKLTLRRNNRTQLTRKIGKMLKLGALMLIRITHYIIYRSYSLPFFRVLMHSPFYRQHPHFSENTANLRETFGGKRGEVLMIMKLGVLLSSANSSLMLKSGGTFDCRRGY